MTMVGILRILFLMTFWFVAVSASEKNSLGHKNYFVDEPEACLQQKKFPCTIKTSKIPLQLEVNKSQLFMGQETAVLMKKPNEVKLLQGRVWMTAAQDSVFWVHTNLKMHLQGEVFCEVLPDRTVRVSNLNAQIQFQSSNLFKAESLPVGFENWYGPLATNGQILRGVIRPIDKGSFVKSWSLISGFSLAELRKKLKDYLDLWAGAVEMSAQMYQEIAERRMASVRDKDLRRQKAQDKVNQEKMELRRIYREKNGL